MTVNKRSKKMKYFIILFFLILWQCTFFNVQQTKPLKKVAIICENNVPIRYHYDQETGTIIEKGMVELPNNIKCKDAETLDEKEILKFPRSGKWTQYYKGTNKILSEGLNKNNKREGRWVFYDQEGKIIRIINYKEGKKEGEEIGYFSYPNLIRYEGKNINNKKEGLWKYYSDPEYQCISQGLYKNDMKEGEWTECSMDEKTKKWYLSFKGNYYMDLKDGPAETYYSNGNLASKGEYRADLKCKENPPPEGMEFCGKRVKKWIFYFPNGRVMEEGNYQQETGRRTGLWKEYYQTGELRAQGNRDHTKIGQWTFYSKNGEIIGQYQFKGNDFMASYCIEFKDNKKVQEGNCTAKMIKYDFDKDELKITEGLKQGIWKGYHPNGKLAWEGELIMGKRNGKWKIYNEDGSLMGEGEYNMDKKTGFWKEMVNGRLMTIEYDMFGRPKN